MAWEFRRHVEEELIKKLIKEPLWKEKLKGDCEKGEVFLTIRNDYISFYHGGGCLFTFDIMEGFKTHIKYASVIDATDENTKINYIRQDQLKNLPLISDFSAGYDGIKKNCELYSGEEAKGVSNLYRKSSYLHDKSIVVLDIEIAFKKNDGKKQDRIDILLYDKKSQTLRFVEAKHFSNSDLWAESTPRVISQIEKYEKQIKQYEENLIREYGLYIDGLNRIFGKQFKKPRDIEPKVSLLIFGFDNAQKHDDRFKKLILNNPEYKKIPYYCKGNPKKDFNAENIWNEAK